VISAIVYRTAWFGLLAGYYFILAIIRLMLANYTGKNSMGERLIAEHRRSRTCAVILLTVNLSLTGVVLMMMYQNRGYEYSGILIYVMAAYTFYITVNAIIKLIRYRKYNSPVMMTTKVTSLASALVSMLALETAMLSQFSDAANQVENFDQIMIGATGGGISAIVIAMSAITIWHANREIKKEKLRRNINNGKQ
jgi:urea transporter